LRSGHGLRIGIDAHYVGVRHGGNEFYFENLLNHLARSSRDGDEYFVFSRDNAARARLRDERLRVLPLRRRSVYWQRAVEIPRYSRRLDLDVLHVPFNFLPVFRCKKIVSIHDLAFLHLPDAYAPLERIRMRVLTRSAARWADHVLTLSEYSKRSIVEHYRLPEDRVTVVPGAVDRDSFRPVEDATARRHRTRLGLPRDYLLFVGAIQRRKNLLVLLEALKVLRAEGRHEVHVVLVGRRGWGAEDVFRFVAEHGLRDVVHHVEPLETETLVALYTGARAFVFPSLFEGFGMPVLEAMSCGCPVICSNATSLPEVCGDAALLFDPHRPEELAERLAKVLGDSAFRAAMVEKGQRNCDRFSWERSAALANAVYHAV
jgi:glycosyltransferase involved in cell wall biosynthesis